MPNDVRKRNLFGLGEIIGVITNVRLSDPKIKLSFTHLLTDETHLACRNCALTD